MTSETAAKALTQIAQAVQSQEVGWNRDLHSRGSGRKPGIAV